MDRVVITDFLADDLEPERRVLAGVAQVEALDAQNEDDLIGRVEDAGAIMMYHTVPLKARILDRLRRCKLIVRCGVGVDNVDHAHAATRGIPVANIPDYGTEDVADSAIGMMLALARGIHHVNSALRDGRGPWSYTQVVPLRRLRGSTLGIVGLGRIGSAVALRAKAIGMRVVFFDPYKADGYDKAMGIARAQTVEELLAESYIVTLHCPLTDQTRHLINARTLALLPRGSILINTSRGQVVDTSLIPETIASGRLSGAGIDVLAQEPPPADDPLVVAWRDRNHPAHDRLILNPHSAFYSEEGVMDMRIKGAQACRQALLGQPLRNVVNTPIAR